MAKFMRHEIHDTDCGPLLGVSYIEKKTFEVKKCDRILSLEKDPFLGVI